MAYPNIFASQSGPLALSLLDANFLYAVDIANAALTANAGGSADAITATYSPAPAALVNGLTLYVRAAQANVTTTPQFSPNGLAGRTIVKASGALVAGDIYGAGHWLQLIYDSTLTAWVLTNPASTQGGNLQATSLNGGQLAGLRNRVINGQGWINQRGNIAATAGLQYGPDRMMASITSGTSISGNISSGSLSGTNTTYGWGLNACSWTNGAAQLAQRIESWNVKDMNSKTVTFSGKLYQDTGGSRTMNIIIQKATAGVDNFSTTSTIASTTVAIPSGTTTAFSFTTTLGASDATNGIMLIVSDTATNTVTSKTYFTSDWQFEIGSVATTFEQRPYGMEMALCQRYYWRSGNGSGDIIVGSAYAAGASQSAYQTISHPVYMRISPTITFAGTWATSNATAPTYSSGANNYFRISCQSAAAGGFLAYNANAGSYLEANAEL